MLWSTSLNNPLELQRSYSAIVCQTLCKNWTLVFVTANDVLELQYLRRGSVSLVGCTPSSTSFLLHSLDFQRKTGLVAYSVCWHVLKPAPSPKLTGLAAMATEAEQITDQSSENDLKICLALMTPKLIILVDMFSDLNIGLLLQHVVS